MGETLVHVPRHPQDFLLASNVLVSNVRGPAEPLYLGGARLEALCPVSTLISGMGLNITFMSYAGQVLVGYTANASALPEADRLGRYTRDAFRRIGTAVTCNGPPPSDARSPAGLRPSEVGDQREVPATLLEFALPSVPDPLMQRAAL